MIFSVAFALLLAAVFANGLLAGASLDQSIKQLPARHRVGITTYSAYSRAADLGNGVLWYGILGIGAALLAVAAAVFAVLLEGTPPTAALPLYVAAGLSVAHSLVTARAAPTNFAQRNAVGDEAALRRIFDRFVRLQTLRVLLQVLTFGMLLWALVAYPPGV